MTHCVYRHIRPDTNEVFYVGIGKKDRPYHKRRTDAWKEIVALNGGEYKIDVLFSEISKEFAEEKEKEFIKLYGRVINCTGTLVNFKLGGKVHTGYVMSPEQKEKAIKNLRSNSCKGKKWSQERKIGFSLKRTGLKQTPNKNSFSLETRQKMSESHKGNSATKNYISITNGVSSRMIPKTEIIPIGWSRGRKLLDQLKHPDKRKLN